MNIYLDDERKTPEGYTRTYTSAQTIAVLKTASNIDILSLDHDLGEDDAGTGYTVTCWLEERAFNDDWDCIPKRFRVHSANPVGRKRMLQCLNNIVNRSNGTRSIID